MYFLKQLSVAVALGFALVDARAINLNGQSEITARDVTAASKGPRALDNPISGKLGLAKREDVDQDKDASRAQAQRCADSLNKLRRKLRRRGALKAKRANDGGAMLGKDSCTVDMGEHRFLSETEAHDEGFELFGTYGINSCSGVLIVGDNGYAVAHLDPIEETEDGSPDPATAQAFHDNVVGQVEADYNSNKENLGNAVMYILTPQGDKGEQDELVKSAQRLGIPVSKNTYQVVDEDGLNDDWFENERGTIYLNRSDTDEKFVVVNGDDPAPAQ